MVDVLTGTPNHPFWVDAVRDYVPLGELEVGTELHVQGGGEAILVSKTWRQGDFEVFDFEVEGLHNFYARGEGSGSAAVLVHNSGTATFKKHVGAEGRHVTVDIKDASGESLGEFHQVIDGKGTAIEQVGGRLAGRKPQATFNVDLPDPHAAAAHGRDMASMGTVKQKHKLGSNDCVTGACNVANAGGANVNPDAVRQNLDMQ
jgi:hypothetical protein